MLKRPTAPRDFCRYLANLLSGEAHALTEEQTAAIRERLAAVFLHAIDPEMGDSDYQNFLSGIHDSKR
jgi:hypothetical protein